MFEFLQDYPELLDVSDVAEILHCSPKTVTKLCRKGELRALKIGKGWSIPQMSLKEFILIKSHFKSGYSSF